jgi:tetratricopeptide (TPR) repeat protein
MYERALEAARELDDPRIAEICLHCGRNAAILGLFDQARSYLAEALDLAHTQVLPKVELAALYELAGLYTSTDYKTAQSLAVRALELARTGDDRRSEGLALNRLGNILSNQLHFAEGRALHDQALEIFESLGDRWGSADCLDLIGMTHYLGGEIVQARRAFTRAIDIFRDLNDRERLASALTTRGSYEAAIEGACQIDASPSECKADVIEALRLCREMNWRAGESFALTMAASAELGNGQIGAAYSRAVESHRVAREINHPQWIVISLLIRGLIHLELDDFDEAAQLFTQSHDFAVKLSSPMWIQRNAVLRLAATRPLNDARLEELRTYSTARIGSQSIGTRKATLAVAEGLCERSRYEESLRMLARLVRDTDTGEPAPVSLIRARALSGLGQHAAADAALLTAKEVAEAVGPRTYLWKIAAARSKLWRHQDPDAYERERGLARTEVEKILGSIDDDEIRHRYLTSDAVRTLYVQG